MRYFIGLIGLALLIFVIVQLIRTRKTKGGKGKYAIYTLLGIILAGWGLASTNTTYAGVSVTQEQSKQITKLTDAQGKVVQQFVGKKWNYSKISTYADKIKSPFKALNKDDSNSILNSAIKDIKQGASNENDAAKQYALNAVQRLNHKTAHSVTGSSSSKDYHAVYNQLEKSSGLTD